MNDEELQNKIKASIKNEKLRKYLLECLKNECALNSLNLPSFLIEKATQRFENKINACQQIEIDLPELPKDSDSYGDYLLLSEKLDILRLNLVILYADSLGSEIIEKKSSYDGIKKFILDILRFKKTQLKLKYFDLTKKLLEKTIKDSQFNKEFIGALDLLKLFVNKSDYLPNEVDLQYIRNLGRETNGEDIRKCFYGIIHELDEKLLFQDLLKQILKIIKKERNSPLIQFNIIFITKCLNDSKMDVSDLNQIVSLVCDVLEHYNELTTKQPRAILRKIFNHLINLNEFKQDLKEKISPAIINNLVNQSSQEKNLYLVADILQGLDFVICFPSHINNKKIKTKLSEAKLEYNQTLEQKTTTNDRFAFKNLKEELVKISNKANTITTNAKSLASDAKGNLEEIAETSTDRLKGLFIKKSETSYLEENEKVDKKALKTSLIQDKEKLLLIKEKLKIWNSIFTLNIEEGYDNSYNLTNQFDLNQCLELVDRFSDSINEKYNQLIQQVIEELEKIRDVIRGKNLWILKSEISKSSIFHKIFRHGYFNRNLTIKKIKAHLSNDLSFAKVNSFILNQSFWGLLSYGIIRWPWMNKIDFAKSWSDQFSFLNDISQIEELKNALTVDHDKEKILKAVIDISNILSPYQSKIVHILDDFKKYLALQLGQLKIFEQEINDYLNEKETSLFSLSSKPIQFFRHNNTCALLSADNGVNGNPLMVLRVH